MEVKNIIKYSIIFFFLVSSISNANDYLSRDPNYIDRGKLWGNAHISNFTKNELSKHNYKVKKDPTGLSPINLIEDFSPKKGDCGTEEHRGTGINDCISGRLRLEVGSKKIKKKNKPFETWLGYYIFFPKNFPEDKYFYPYITQFYLSSNLQKGGFAPKFAASLTRNREIISNGKIIVSKENLKGKWHKIEYHIRWSTKKDGFFRVYHNGLLKSEQNNLITMTHDQVQIKYGTYSYKDNSTMYPPEYKFPSHSIYYSGVNISKSRDKLKVNQ